MCLAVPGRVEEVLDDGFGIVDFFGLKKKVALDLLEHTGPGDYVLVHAGFAISKLNRKEALETIEYLDQLGHGEDAAG